jgi:ADP-heptose:LPS heptosyltransferase
MTPALRALRVALPQAEIDLVGLPEVKGLVARYNRYLDSLIEFPGYPGLAEQTPRLAEFPAFLKKVQSKHFDLALQMQGSGSITNPLTVLFGARYNAGFYLPDQFCPDEARFLPYIENEPEARRYLRLLEHLGIPSQGEELEFPLYPEDEQMLYALPEMQTLSPGQYVCLHPGASTEAKRWMPESFATVGDALARQGLQVVLTGSAGEAAVAEMVGQAMRAPFLNLAGRTNLGSLGVLLSRSRLLICNDTGVSHVAAALKVPSVIIFTAAHPDRWAPLNRKLHKAVYRKVECSPCPHTVCPIDHRCATGISPKLVLAQAKTLLQTERERVYAA